MNEEKFTNILLFLGVFLGISLALFFSIKDTNFQSEEDWVAKVGDAKISRSKYQIQLEGLISDRRSELDDEARAFVLERMIEEELLIQRAKDLGMLSTNTMVRGTLVQQMINLIISENSFIPIQEAELRSFYEENKPFFTSADRLRVRQFFFSDKKEDSEKRALNFYKDLIENGVSGKLNNYVDISPLQVPDILMTLSKVREYLGPSLMQIAKQMQPGEFSPPQKILGGYKILYLVDRKDSFPPEFSSIRDRVKSEYLKRKDDEALREYLEELKNWYDINRKLEI